MKQEIDDLERAYRTGLLAGLRQSISIVKNPIEAPIYDAIYSKRLAENMTQAFWNGVNDWSDRHKRQSCPGEKENDRRSNRAQS